MFPKPQNHIDNSFILVKKLNDKIIDEEKALLSLDVISSFTNIPINLNCLAKKQEHVAKRTNIPKN